MDDARFEVCNTFMLAEFELYQLFFQVGNIILVVHDFTREMNRAP